MVRLLMFVLFFAALFGISHVAGLLGVFALLVTVGPLAMTPSVWFIPDLDDGL